MRLQVLVPLLPQNLINALEEIGIRTDADLLFSGGAIETFGKLPSGTVQLHEFRDLMSKVAESACAPVLRGDEYSALGAKPRADRLNERITSGVSVLDALVGGFSRPRVLEISGDRGSGKTSLALQVVLRHLAHSPESGALWIDTTGEFSAERVSILLQSYDGQATSTALERLQVALAFDIEAVHDILEMLRLSLNPDLPSSPYVRCVVIDTITPILGPLLSATSSQGHAIMTTFMRQLRALAETFSLTIIVVNTSTNCIPRNPDSAFFTSRKPALGPSFTFLTDVTIWLSHRPSESDDAEDNTTTHVVEVLRSRTTRSRTWCAFKIREGVLTSD